MLNFVTKLKKMLTEGEKKGVKARRDFPVFSGAAEVWLK